MYDNNIDVLRDLLSLTAERLNTKITENEKMQRRIKFLSDQNALMHSALRRISVTGEHRLVTIHDDGMYFNEMRFFPSDGANIARETLLSLEGFKNAV